MCYNDCLTVVPQLHSLATSFRGHPGTQLIKSVVQAYNLVAFEGENRYRKVKGLLQDGNLAYRIVGFASNGDLLRHSVTDEVYLISLPHHTYTDIYRSFVLDHLNITVSRTPSTPLPSKVALHLRR
jgi:hypothetical protein